jgi:replicative DNA helicase
MRMSRKYSEAAVLGAIASDPSCASKLWRLARSIQWQGGDPDGRGNAHQVIADAISECVSRGEEPDVLNVGHELYAAGKPWAIAEFGILGSKAPPIEQSEGHLRLLLELERRQEVSSLLHRAEIDLKAGGATPEDIVSRLRSFEPDGRFGEKQSLVMTSKEVCEDLLEELQACWDGTKESPFVNSFFPGINKLIGGYITKHWTVVAARQKRGKSVYAEQEAYFQSFRGKPVVFCPLEMHAKRHMHRIAIRVSECGLSSAELFERPDKLKPDSEITKRVEQLSKFTGAVYELQEFPLYWADCRGDRSVESVIASLTEAYEECVEKEGVPPSLIVVDYFQQIETLSKFAREDLGYADSLKALSRWISQRDSAGVLIAQLNRAVEKEDRLPRASDLRECGQLEQEAAAIVFIHRPKRDDKGEGIEECQLVVSDARFGTTGVADVWWRGAHQRFETPDKTERKDWPVW